MKIEGKRKTGMGRVFATLTVLVATTLAIPIPSAASERSVASLSIAERASLEQKIDEIGNKVANRKPYFENDHEPIHLKSEFDVVANMLIVHADERLGPVSTYPQMEQLQQEVQQAIWSLLENFKGFRGLDWRYGGKDMYFWFPGDRPVGDKPRRSEDEKTAPGGAVSRIVVPEPAGVTHPPREPMRPSRLRH